jgi:hypothetical protein
MPQTDNVQDTPGADEQQSSELPRHYVAFSFTGDRAGGQRPGEASVTASCYLGFPDQRISIPRVLRAKQGAGVEPSAVLLAVSYLGLMTSAEIRDLT